MYVGEVWKITLSLYPQEEQLPEILPYVRDTLHEFLSFSAYWQTHFPPFGGMWLIVWFMAFVVNGVQQSKCPLMTLSY